MSLLGDFMKALAGTDGIGRDTAALVGNPNTGNVPVTHQAFDFTFQYGKAAADGSAAATTADTLIWTNPFDFNVSLVAARILGVGAGITGDAANIATITLKTDNGAGGATAIALTWSSLTTDGGTLTSNQSKLFTLLTPANQVVVPGGNVWFNIAKGGSGVVVPISNYILRIQKGEF
jgi:hypothetical protein